LSTAPVNSAIIGADIVATTCQFTVNSPWP
jgi:hypothetical protein